MMRREALKITGFIHIVVAGMLALSGCQRTPAPERVGAMGAPMSVGQLNYTVLETEWRDSLDSSQGPRAPKSRFLLVHLTVMNAASEQKAAPLLQVIDSKGAIHAEITEGDGVPDWLGYLRLLPPGENRSGRILFDVPQGAYKLRVSSGGDAESEQSALIDLPLQLNSEVPHTSADPGFAGAPAAPAPSKK